MARSEGDLGLGAVGAGGFGLFALQQFVQVSGIRLAAARRFGIPDVQSVDALLARGQARDRGEDAPLRRAAASDDGRPAGLDPSRLAGGPRAPT
jgi:hypothetical protein